MVEKTETYCYYTGKGSRANEIHDAYRIAYYNQLYYGERLRKARLLNCWYDVSIVVFTLVTFISLVIPSTRSWVVSLTSSAIAALTACAKPYLPLVREVDRLAMLFASYGIAFLDLESLEGDMRHTNDVTPEIEVRFATIKGKLAKVGEMDDPVMKQPLWDKCREKGNLAIPVETLWMPKGSCKERVQSLHSPNHDSEATAAEAPTNYCQKEFETDSPSSSRPATPSIIATETSQKVIN